MTRLGGNIRKERKQILTQKVKEEEEQEKVTKRRLVHHGKHHQEAIMKMITVITACGYQIAKMIQHGQVLEHGQALVLMIKHG